MDLELDTLDRLELTDVIKSKLKRNRCRIQAASNITRAQVIGSKRCICKVGSLSSQLAASILGEVALISWAIWVNLQLGR